MKQVHLKVSHINPTSFPKGRINIKQVDGTTERDISRHSAEDDAEAMLEAAKYTRRIRKRLGLSQAELSKRIDVSLDTIRNWEQGKRSPTGAAKALLKILDHAPELALSALDLDWNGKGQKLPKNTRKRLELARI
jgi:putative transcriptional regulator